MSFLTTSPFQWFVSGGPIGMCGITLFLIALFFAAWKAPAWVKEIGIAGLVFSAFIRLQCPANLCISLRHMGGFHSMESIKNHCQPAAVSDSRIRSAQHMFHRMCC